MITPKQGKGCSQSSESASAPAAGSGLALVEEHYSPERQNPQAVHHEDGICGSSCVVLEDIRAYGMEPKRITRQSGHRRLDHSSGGLCDSDLMLVL
jgi:hypothetical protein